MNQTSQNLPPEMAPSRYIEKVSLVSGEVLETNVATVRSRIVGLGDYEAKEVVDLDGPGPEGSGLFTTGVTGRSEVSRYDGASWSVIARSLGSSPMKARVSMSNT